MIWEGSEWMRGNGKENKHRKCSSSLRLNGRVALCEFEFKEFIFVLYWDVRSGFICVIRRDG